jgi:hypothetical protein
MGMVYFISRESKNQLFPPLQCCIAKSVKGGEATAVGGSESAAKAAASERCFLDLRFRAQFQIRWLQKKQKQNRADVEFFQFQWPSFRQTEREHWPMQCTD